LLKTNSRKLKMPKPVVPQEPRMMTFQELYEWLEEMGEDARQNHATVYYPGEDEYHCVDSVKFEEETDVLDEGHPVIVLVE
jgi:hypothetical protein